MAPAKGEGSINFSDGTQQFRNFVHLFRSSQLSDLPNGSCSLCVCKCFSFSGLWIQHVVPTKQNRSSAPTTTGAFAYFVLFSLFLLWNSDFTFQWSQGGCLQVFHSPM